MQTSASSRGSGSKILGLTATHSSPLKPLINASPTKHTLASFANAVPTPSTSQQGIDRLLLMHTVSGICQRLIQKDSRFSAAGSISDFLHLLATRETRRALEQGKANSTRELEDLEKRIYSQVAQFIEQKASGIVMVPRVHANGKIGLKQTRKLPDITTDSDALSTGFGGTGTLNSISNSPKTSFHFHQSPRIQG